MDRHDYAQARKQYVEEVRRSFHQKEDDDFRDEQPLSTDSASFFKLRLLIAVCIFAAFILCDRTGSSFYHYSTDEIITMIQKQQLQPQLESIREAWNLIAKKQDE